MCFYKVAKQSVGGTVSSGLEKEKCKYLGFS